MSEPSAKHFEDFPLSPHLRDALREMGYEKPSPIQAELIPKALTGRDCIGQAQTGTGKTAAFLIPILEQLSERRVPQALILAPTRELVQQVYQEALRLIGERDLPICCLYGGQPIRKQMFQLQEGGVLVVGTPGRVIDMMGRGYLKVGGMQFLVLDEADRMLDIGFRPDIEKVMRKLPQPRQTLLLSATLPDEVRRLAHRYMNDPVSINLSPDKISVDSIDQYYFTVDHDRKLPLLLRLLMRERPRQCIIFCQMKVHVRKLTDQLGKRIKGVKAMEGDMQQNVRNRVIDRFRSGDVRILVATDVVGRGIDVEGISHVINYDCPEDVDTYVHRIGRTGRMGKDGRSFTFVCPDQGSMLTDIERHVNVLLKRDQFDDFHAHSRKRRWDEKDPDADDEPLDDGKPKIDRHGRVKSSKKYSNRL